MKIWKNYCNHQIFVALPWCHNLTKTKIFEPSPVSTSLLVQYKGISNYLLSLRHYFTLAAQTSYRTHSWINFMINVLIVVEAIILIHHTMRFLVPPVAEINCVKNSLRVHKWITKKGYAENVKKKSSEPFGSYLLNRTANSAHFH